MKRLFEELLLFFSLSKTKSYEKVCFSLAIVTALILSSFTSTAQKAVNFNEHFNFDVSSFPSIFNPCSGESVDLSGSVNAVVHGVANQNKISLTLHANFQNLGAEGQTSGNSYSGGGAINIHFNESFNGAFNAHATASTVLTTAGRDNNVFLKFNFHITVNANGEVTAEVLNVTADCR